MVSTKKKKTPLLCGVPPGLHVAPRTLCPLEPEQSLMCSCSRDRTKATRSSTLGATELPPWTCHRPARGPSVTVGAIGDRRNTGECWRSPPLTRHGTHPSERTTESGGPTQHTLCEKRHNTSHARVPRPGTEDGVPCPCRGANPRTTWGFTRSLWGAQAPVKPPRFIKA